VKPQVNAGSSLLKWGTAHLDARSNHYIQPRSTYGGDADMEENWRDGAAVDLKVLAGANKGKHGK